MNHYLYDKISSSLCLLRWLLILTLLNLRECQENLALQISSLLQSDKHFSLVVEHSFIQVTQNHLANVSLDGILTQLANMDRVCHVLIDNFKGVSISPPKYPTVIRRSFPETFYSNKSKIRLAYLWLPTALFNASSRREPHIINQTHDNIIRIQCPNSNYILNVSTITYIRDTVQVFDMCVRLDAFKLSSRSKPWGCEVHISLFIPSLFVEELTPPIVFNYDVTYSQWNALLKQFQTSFPSKTERIHVLLEEEHEFKLNWQMNTVKKWIYKTKNTNRVWVENDQSVYIKHYSFFVALLKKSGKVRDLHIITRFFRLSTFPSMRLISGGYDFSVMVNLQPVHKLIPHASPEIEPSMWELHKYDYIKRKAIDNYNNHFKLCENYLWPTSKVSSVSKLPFESPEDIIAHAIVSLWMTIMKNFTITSERHLCYDGKQMFWKPDGSHLDFISYLRPIPSSGSIFFPTDFSVPNKINDLRFVSCGGKNGMQEIHIRELTKVYQVPVWTLIVVFSFAVVCFDYISARNVTFGNHVFMILKCLLEQGNPFDCFVLNTPQLKYVVISYLLASVVLSNAYKNTNVYNMISPKLPKPYEKLSELVRDNFSILTRSHILQFNLYQIYLEWFKLTREYPENFFLSPVNHRRFGRHILLDRKYDAMIIESEILFLKGMTGSYTWSTDASIEALFNNTKLYPLLTKLARKIVQEAWPKWDFFVSEAAQKYFSRLEEKIRQEGERSLYGFLQGCNKTALVLPYYKCNEIGRRLQTLDNKMNVYVGTEKYVSIRTDFIIDGLIHPNVIKRIKSITSSGIVNWWVQYVGKSRKYIQFNREGTRLTKPNMTGNIQLIFFVLLSGQLISCVAYCLEMVTFAF